MEELKHLRSSCRGYQSRLFKTLTSLSAILEGDPSASLKEEDEVMLLNSYSERKTFCVTSTNEEQSALLMEANLRWKYTKLKKPKETQSSILDTIAKIN